jgi:hypothetical protein
MSWVSVRPVLQEGRDLEPTFGWSRRKTPIPRGFSCHPFSLVPLRVPSLPAQRLDRAQARRPERGIDTEEETNRH